MKWPAQRRRASLALLLLALALLALKIGEVAGEFTLPYLLTPDQEFTLSHYLAQGKEPKPALLISFFSASCVPCRLEIPVLQQWHQRYGPRGLLVVSICIDEPGQLSDKAKTIYRQAGVGFPVLHDRLQIVGQRYQADPIPKLFLLDGRGAVAGIYFGAGPGTQSLIERDILRLLPKMKS